MNIQNSNTSHPSPPPRGFLGRQSVVRAAKAGPLSWRSLPLQMQHLIYLMTCCLMYSRMLRQHIKDIGIDDSIDLTIWSLPP